MYTIERYYIYYFPYIMYICTVYLQQQQMVKWLSNDCSLSCIYTLVLGLFILLLLDSQNTGATAEWDSKYLFHLLVLYAHQKCSRLLMQEEVYCFSSPVLTSKVALDIFFYFVCVIYWFLPWAFSPPSHVMEIKHTTWWAFTRASRSYKSPHIQQPHNNLISYFWNMKCKQC